MQSTHIRNKHALLGIQIALLLFTSAATVSGQTFKWAKRNNPEFDKRKISYGFMIGIHTSGYQLKYADQFVTQKFDTVHSVQAPFSGGFSLGFLVNLRLHEVLDLRIMPKAGFYNHKLIYYFTDNTTKTQLVETTMVEMPILIKYKSMRRGNVRMYMVGGFTPSIEASGKNDVESTTASLSIRNSNLTLDAGFGFDFYFPLFKFSQEIRFQHGMLNMLNGSNGPYGAPLKQLTTNTVSVYFIFQ
jgi:hypothetical protein